MRHILLLLFLLTTPIWAALRPQSPEELTQRADEVLIGEVLSIKSSTVRVSRGRDTVYRIELRVDKAEKGSHTAGKVVKLECRKTLRRPVGWAGPQGQNEIPEKGQIIKAYLSKSPKGDLKLLEPNGWSPSDSIE